MTGRERADRIRAVASYWEADELMGLVPPGSVVLTPDDVGALLGLIKGAQLDDAHPNMDVALRLLGGAQ